MIYCIMGPTATGKSTIAKEVSKKLKVDLVISYTSRPKRKNEVEGIDYYYVDNQYFADHEDEFVEIRDYHVYDGSLWRYGYKESEFSDPNRDKIVVIETDGFNMFKDHFGIERLCPILINSFESEILERLKKRGDNPEEIKRRIADDMAKFSKFTKNEKCIKVYNHFDLDFAVTHVKKIIEQGGKINRG